MSLLHPIIKKRKRNSGRVEFIYEPPPLRTLIVQKYPIVRTSFVPYCFRAGLRWYVVYPTTTPPFKMAFFVDWDRHLVIVHVTSPAVPPDELLLLTNKAYIVDEKDRTTTVRINIPDDIIRELDYNAKPLKIGTHEPNSPDIPCDGIVGVALILCAEYHENTGFVAV